MKIINLYWDVNDRKQIQRIKLKYCFLPPWLPDKNSISIYVRMFSTK